MTYVGYFDGPEQTTPAFDPGMGIDCLVCIKPLRDAPVITTSLLRPGDERSYFVRAHKGCWDGLSEAEQTGYEWSVFDD